MTSQLPLGSATRSSSGQAERALRRAFEGVALEPRRGQTTLRGDFADQSQLYGLLNRLRDFGIELISVNAVDVSPSRLRRVRSPAAGA